MTDKEKEEIKKLNRVAFKKLRNYFTEEPDELFENGYIGFHPNVKDDIIEEIVELTSNLDEYVKENFSHANLDYHHNSESGCYFLSTIFCLSNSSWNIVQGIFDFKDQDKKYYHSWLEKEEIIYDPAMRVVTIKTLYEEFFIEKYKYNKEQLKELFKRTAMFTYYEEDLKYGNVNPMGKMFYYDTEKCLNDATEILNKLDNFLNQKNKINC